MTANVTLGHRYERAYADYLRNKGYRVQRSAASKGLFDLIAYRLSDVVFVQCKSGAMSCDVAKMVVQTYRGTIPFYARARVTHRDVRGNVEYCEHDDTP